MKIFCRFKGAGNTRAVFFSQALPRTQSSHFKSASPLMEKPSAASTDPGDGAPHESPSHPPELVSFDEPYFAPWGSREILIWSIICSHSLAVCLVLAWFFSSWFAAGSALIVPFWAFMVLFFRNPSREITADADVLVAPADGTVWDIGEIEEQDYIEGRCLRIGIFLSVFNVHVNREKGVASTRKRESQKSKIFARRFAPKSRFSII